MFMTWSTIWYSSPWSMILYYHLYLTLKGFPTYTPSQGFPKFITAKYFCFLDTSFENSWWFRHIFSIQIVTSISTVFKKYRWTKIDSLIFISSMISVIELFASYIYYAACGISRVLGYNLFGGYVRLKLKIISCFLLLIPNFNYFIKFIFIFMVCHRFIFFIGFASVYN